MGRATVWFWTDVGAQTQEKCQQTIIRFHGIFRRYYAILANLVYKHQTSAACANLAISPTQEGNTKEATLICPRMPP
jgi:hypothetical protein